VDEYQTNVKQNKSDTRKYMLYDSIYIKFLKRQNESIVTESTSVVAWGWGSWRTDWESEQGTLLGVDER